MNDTTAFSQPDSVDPPQDPFDDRPPFSIRSLGVSRRERFENHKKIVINLFKVGISIRAYEEYIALCFPDEKEYIEDTLGDDWSRPWEIATSIFEDYVRSTSQYIESHRFTTQKDVVDLFPIVLSAFGMGRLYHALTEDPKCLDGYDLIEVFADQSKDSYMFLSGALKLFSVTDKMNTWERHPIKCISSHKDDCDQEKILEKPTWFMRCDYLDNTNITPNNTMSFWCNNQSADENPLAILGRLIDPPCSPSDFLFYATDQENARHIVVEGFNVNMGRTLCDFSHSPALYFHTNIRDALQYLKIHFIRSGALLILRKPTNLDQRPFSEHTLDFGAPSDQLTNWSRLDEWKEYVRKCCSYRTHDNPYTCIIGPKAQTKNRRIDPTPRWTVDHLQQNYSSPVIQWCIRSQPAAQIFDTLCVAVVFVHGI